MITLPTSTTTLIPPNPTGIRRPLLTPLPEPGHFLLVLDNSSAEKFTTCPTAAKFYLVNGREGQTKSPALTFGGAFHQGAEKFLHWQHAIKAVSSINNNELAVETTTELYGPDAQDLAIVKFFCENPLPLELNPDYRTVESCLEVMRHYRFQAQLPDYQWEVLSDDSGPVIERAFELPLGVLEVGEWINTPWPFTYEALQTLFLWGADGKNYNNFSDCITETAVGDYGDVTKQKVFCSHIHVAWSGRIDAVVHAHGMARVCDHKTTSDKRYLNPQKYHLANQTIGYVWAAKQLFPSLDVRGFLLNGVIFRKPTGSGSIFDRGPRGGDPALSFARYNYEYSEERLKWWADNAMLIVSDFVHCLVRNEFPSHTVACHGTYGPCPYLEICEQDSQPLRDALLSSDRFKTVTWNPVKP